MSVHNSVSLQQHAEIRTRDGAPRHVEQPAKASRKRKREDGELAGKASKRITIRASSSSVYDKPRILTPLRSIPRAQLPLSYLDPTSDVSEISTTQLFSARIDSLEVPQTGNNSDGPQVLIARVEDTQRLYAVERVSDGLYALCKLSSWVKVEHLHSCQTWANISHAISTDARTAETTTSWVQSALLASAEIPKKPLISAPGKLSMRRPLGRDEKTSNALQIEQSEDTDAIKILTEPEPHDPDPIAPLVGISTEPEFSARQVLEQLVKNYLDSLYLAKTSLAFFAKGPLSRARTAFSSNQDPSLAPLELTTFLRSLILSASSMDKKYREKLPTVVKSIVGSTHSEGEDHSVTRPPSITWRPSKRLKPNRDGTLPMEEKYMKAWWSSAPTSAAVQTAALAESSLKESAASLRTRETFLQIVLCLEVLALEASPPFQTEPVQESTAALQTRTNVDRAGKTNEKAKTKKPQDLSMLIDVLIDKLCIWQSIEAEDDSSNRKQKGSQSGGGRSSQPSAGDVLKAFSIEVVIPFYMSRLPEKAASINKELGGPSAISPAKRPKAKTARKPSDTDVKIGQNKRQRKPLQRVATDTGKEQLPRHPSLARSVTDSAIVPGLKRENSEVPLSVIPHKDATSHRGTLSQYKQFSRREVDLTAMSSAHDAKIRKKVQIEEALQDAISTLKKPNRGQAVKEYADNTDRRAKASRQQARKSSNPSKKTAQSVQVTATPKRVEKKHRIPPTPVHDYGKRETEGSPTRSAGTSRIPSSTIRPPPTSVVPPIGQYRADEPHRNRLNAVEETPSRGPSKFVSFADIGDDTVAPMSSLSTAARAMSRIAVATSGSVPSHLQQTPTRPRPLGSHNPMGQNRQPVFATPSKRYDAVTTAETIADTPAISRTRDAAEAGRSIYDALGWDDDEI